MTSKSSCYCGSSLSYADCCQPFHRGARKAETAEKLMRSRYSAYVAGQIDYVDQTNVILRNKSYANENYHSYTATL